MKHWEQSQPLTMERKTTLTMGLGIMTMKSLEKLGETRLRGWMLLLAQPEDGGGELAIKIYFCKVSQLGFTNSVFARICKC